MSDANFDELVDQAKASGDVRDVWRAVYQLDSLWILSSPSAVEPAPFIGVVDGQNWVFAFTDAQRLAQSAPVILGTAGDQAGIKMDMEQAIGWLDSLRPTVFGVRINEGPNGIFAPLSNVIPMRDYYAQESGPSL